MQRKAENGGLSMMGLQSTEELSRLVRDVITESKAGGEAKTSIFIGLYTPRIVSFLSYKIRTSHLAPVVDENDLSQETWVKLFIRLLSPNEEDGTHPLEGFVLESAKFSVICLMRL